MGPTSDLAERLARVFARVIDRLLTGASRVAFKSGRFSAVKAIAVLLLAGLGGGPDGSRGLFNVDILCKSLSYQMF